MSPDEKAWQAVRSRIALAARRAGRDPAAVELLAVSKAQPAAKVRAAYAQGQRAFGENYVQEASLKSGQLSDLSDIEWHLIGPLQSNKTRLAAALFEWVQSIDRLKTAERLSAARDAHAAPLNVCVQVNISGERSKSGVAPADALALARAVSRLPSLALRGFMGIAEEMGDILDFEFEDLCGRGARDTSEHKDEARHKPHGVLPGFLSGVGSPRPLSARLQGVGAIGKGVVTPRWRGGPP